MMDVTRNVLYCKSVCMRSGVLPVEKEHFKSHSAVKSMFFSFDLYLISLAIMYICFFCPAITLKREFDHVPIHLDRGLVSLVSFVALPRWPPSGMTCL